MVSIPPGRDLKKQVFSVQEPVVWQALNWVLYVPALRTLQSGELNGKMTNFHHTKNRYVCVLWYGEVQVPVETIWEDQGRLLGNLRSWRMSRVIQVNGVEKAILVRVNSILKAQWGHRKKRAVLSSSDFQWVWQSWEKRGRQGLCLEGPWESNCKKFKCYPVDSVKPLADFLC